MTTEIFTTYKVLEIRELIGGSALSPMVIICEKSETKERRRIEVFRSNAAYQTAKMLTSGDTFGVREWKTDDGKRLIRELITYFNEEELAEDEF